MGGISVFLLILIIIVRVVVYYSKKNYDGHYDPSPLPPKPQQTTAEPKAVAPGKPFYTNSPQHWGTITDEFLASNKQFVDAYDSKRSDYVISKREWMVNSLVLMGNINTALQKKTGGKIVSSYGSALIDSDERYATSCCIEKLFKNGILSISGIVIDNYQRYGVILCDQPTSIKYINQLRTHFIEDGYTDLIYFAVTDPETVSVEKPVKFEDFNKTCFKFDKDKQGVNNWQYSDYAMWWAGETEPDFDSAVIKDDIRIYLEMLDFHNSYALGVLSAAFGLKEDNNRVKLPDEDKVIITGPEGVEIIISLSNQRGINFHFPMLPRFEKYRNKFIKVYCNFCYNIRAQIVEKDLPNDSFQTTSTLLWYEQLPDTDKLVVLGHFTKPAS